MTGKEQSFNPEEVLRGKKILIVDDKQSIIEGLKLVLETVGVEDIDMAQDGQKALDLLKDQPYFDLIITDLIMPNMSGTDFILEVIKDPSLTTCKSFILHTSANQNSAKNIVEDLNYLSERDNAGLKISSLPKPNFRKSIISSIVTSILESPTS
jgi:CheY-like chemotaxis protein